MIDERIRLIERAAAAGDHLARLRLLAERHRAGQLSVDQLRLAAHCGDAAARELVGVGAFDHPSMKHWFLALAPYGKLAAVRAAVAATRIAVPFWTQVGWSASLEAHRAAATWVACPCEHHRLAAANAVTAWFEWLLDERRSNGFLDESAARAALNVANAAARLDRTERDRARAAVNASHDAAAAAWHVIGIPRVAARSRERRSALQASGLDRLTEVDLRAAVEAEVRAWALGQAV
jgi:hypothetical protein